MSRARLLAAAFGADGTLNTSDVAGLSTVAVSGQYTDLLGKPVLSTVATSGLFADLLSKPTTLSGYGISDALASATAASTYQTILVSGTSIKTVNGNSVLGSGNIQIDGGVTSFNTRTGAVTLSSGDVTTALGYTPYNSSNPSGYTSNTGTVTSVSGTGTVSGLTLTGSVTTSGSLTLGGTLSLTSGNVTTALGYTPPQPTGTGASGTWGISISGNAATVTNGVYQNAYGSFQSSFTSNIDANVNRNVGAYGSYASGATNTPTNAGILLNFTSGSDGSGDGLQIWSDYNNANNLYQRRRWGGTYSAWGQILTSGNYSSYALPLSGGTMTGSVEVTSGQNVRFGHPSQSDGNDGKIGAGLYGTGLNIVGTQTAAGGGRIIRLFGSLLTDGGQVYIHSGNIGSYSSGGTPTLNVTSSTSFTAVASNHYVLIGGATTVTLPASPAAGAVVWITVANGRTDNVIARNGQNINSLAENMTIDQANAGIQLRYADATRGWIFT